MSQSATLYRVTSDRFTVIEKTNGKKVDPEEISEGYSTYAGTFMALEFILSKDRSEDECKLVAGIFNPVNNIGVEDMANVSLDTVDPEVLSNMLDSVSFIPPQRVNEIYELLSTVSKEEVSNSYNSKELNDNAIYPWCWHDGVGKDEAYNKRHLVEDFVELKDFFGKAAASNNYVLCYVG